MFVIGEAKEKIRNTFEDVVPVTLSRDLDEAVVLAHREAKAGDCVLLSPMCASFDMFNDFEHRGRVFKEIVHRLK